jgi:hypothetical protein
LINCCVVAWFPRRRHSSRGRTIARIRRDRWRREQFFDAGFNVAIAAVLAGVVLGVWMIIDRSGLSAISSDLVDLFSEEVGDGGAANGPVDVALCRRHRAHRDRARDLVVGQSGTSRCKWPPPPPLA